MRYQQDLEVGLRERLRRLLVAHYTGAVQEVGLTVGWINQRPALRTLLAEAERAEPDLDFDQFETAVRNARRGLNWPNRTEEGRASLVWKLMQRIAANSDPDGSVAVSYARGVSWGTKNLNDSWREFTERIIEPLFNFLTERVGTESSVLYILERYVRRIEWFDRKELYDRAVADGQKTEEVYDTDLRRFLFSEGINMPFSQARSASGESDIVSELDGDDPLVCELKVFDAAGRGKRHLGGGVHQAVQYATDYGKNTAYLVIVNISGRPLTLPTDGDPKVRPPFLDVAGVRVHLVAVRAKPTASASKLGKPAPITIARDDLIDPDATDDDPT
jgi:hypothetical protein